VAYEDILHNLHYEWYLRCRQTKVAQTRTVYEEELRKSAERSKAVADERNKDPESPVQDEDMGWDNPQPSAPSS
jgi:hypothetical protein